MGLAHEKKSYLQEKANLFEIGSLKKQFLFTEHSLLHIRLEKIDRSNGFAEFMVSLPAANTIRGVCETEF